MGWLVRWILTAFYLPAVLGEADKSVRGSEARYYGEPSDPSEGLLVEVRTLAEQVALLNARQTRDRSKLRQLECRERSARTAMGAMRSDLQQVRRHVDRITARLEDDHDLGFDLDPEVFFKEAAEAAGTATLPLLGRRQGGKNERIERWGRGIRTKEGKGESSQALARAATEEAGPLGKSDARTSSSVATPSFSPASSSTSSYAVRSRPRQAEERWLRIPAGGQRNARGRQLQGSAESTPSLSGRRRRARLEQHHPVSSSSSPFSSPSLVRQARSANSEKSDADVTGIDSSSSTGVLDDQSQDNARNNLQEPEETKAGGFGSDIDVNVEKAGSDVVGETVPVRNGGRDGGARTVSGRQEKPEQLGSETDSAESDDDGNGSEGTGSDGRNETGRVGNDAAGNALETADSERRNEATLLGTDSRGRNGSFESDEVRNEGGRNVSAGQDEAGHVGQNGTGDESEIAGNGERNETGSLHSDTRRESRPVETDTGKESRDVGRTGKDRGAKDDEAEPLGSNASAGNAAGISASGTTPGDASDDSNVTAILTSRVNGDVTSVEVEGSGGGDEFFDLEDSSEDASSQEDDKEGKGKDRGRGGGKEEEEGVGFHGNRTEVVSDPTRSSTTTTTTTTNPTTPTPLTTNTISTLTRASVTTPTSSSSTFSPSAASPSSTATTIITTTTTNNNDTDITTVSSSHDTSPTTPSATSTTTSFPPCPTHADLAHLQRRVEDLESRLNASLNTTAEDIEGVVLAAVNATIRGHAQSEAAERDEALERVQGRVAQLGSTVSHLAGRVASLRLKEFVDRLHSSLVNFTANVLTLEQWRTASEQIINSTQGVHGAISDLDRRVAGNAEVTSELRMTLRDYRAMSGRQYRLLQAHIIRLNNSLQDLQERAVNHDLRQHKKPNNNDKYDKHSNNGRTRSRDRAAVPPTSKPGVADENGVVLVSRVDDLTLQMVYSDNRLSHLETQFLNASLIACTKANNDLYQDASLLRVNQHVADLQRDVMLLQDTSKRLDLGLYRLHGDVKDSVQAVRKVQSQATDVAEVKAGVNVLRKEVEKLLLQLPVDCQDYYDRGYRSSGDYVINPRSAPHSIRVRCVMRTNSGNYDDSSSSSKRDPDGKRTSNRNNDDLDEGGWTVIQQRFSGKVNFTRSWTEYAVGFGSTTSEYWLGNEHLHYLTSARNYSLAISMTDVFGGRWRATYRRFAISGKDDNYRLTLSSYYGNATDSLTYSAGATFSTWDRDNDLSSSPCALYNGGGWWYSHCHVSNLNGPYQLGIIWFHTGWHDWLQLRRVVMVIKPNGARAGSRGGRGGVGGGGGGGEGDDDGPSQETL